MLHLLGPPDMEWTDTTLSYKLGMWSGFRIDYNSLEIQFDERGQAKRAVFVQH